MSTIDPSLSFRDARNQLLRQLDVGVQYPIAELVVTTANVGAQSNTPTIRYSKVGFDQQETITIHHPQENTKYTLISDDNIPNEEIDHSKTPSGLHASEQASIVLLTPTINTVERTFRILATEQYRGLQRYLDTVVKVRSGVNTGLEVQQSELVVNYLESVTFSILNAQIDCEYYLVEANSNIEAEQLPLSNIDYSKSVRTAQLTITDLKENRDLKIYARFRTSNIYDYLLATLHIDVRPNRALNLNPKVDPLPYCSDASVTAGVPETTAEVVLHGTQASADYSLYIDWVDPVTAPQRVGDLISAAHSGSSDGPLVIPLTQKLSEDVAVKVMAINRESGIEVELHQRVRFNIQPSPLAKLTYSGQSIASGEVATITVENAQIGIYYQLIRDGNGHKIGSPQYLSKKRTIEEAAVEIDLSVAPNDPLFLGSTPASETVELTTTPLSSALKLRLRATKPVNKESIDIRTDPPFEIVVGS